MCPLEAGRSYSGSMTSLIFCLIGAAITFVMNVTAPPKPRAPQPPPAVVVPAKPDAAKGCPAEACAPGTETPGL